MQERKRSKRRERKQQQNKEEEERDKQTRRREKIKSRGKEALGAVVVGGVVDVNVRREGEEVRGAWASRRGGGPGGSARQAGRQTAEGYTAGKGPLDGRERGGGCELVIHWSLLLRGSALKEGSCVQNRTWNS